MRKKMTKQKIKKNKWMPVLLVIMAAFFATAHLQPLSMTNAASKIIKLNYNKKTLKIGKQFKLKATISKNKLKSKKVVWKSSDNLIATVTQKGLVEAKSEGYAKISATIKGTGHRASCSVVVKRNNSTSNTAGKDNIIASYGLKEAHNFSENRAWVEYEDDDYKHYYGIIDTTGKLIYSISNFSGLSDFTNSTIDAKQFKDGISYYYPKYNYGDGGFGFVILDKNGNVTYRSDDGDDTTDFYILEYGGGAFLVEKKVYSLSGDSYFIYTIDKYGNKLSEELPIDKLFIRGEFEYLTDGIFVGNHSNIWYEYSRMVYNQNTNQLFEIGKINNKELRFTSEVYDGKVMDERSGLIIPISALQSEADFNQFKNGNLEYLPGSWYAEHPDGNDDDDDDNNDRKYDWGGGTTISDDLYYSQRHECFYDYNGKLVFKIPDFGENVSIEEISDFTGGYAAVHLKNANYDDYLTLLDRTGKIVYEPIRVTFSQWWSCCNGYVDAKLNDYNYISPDGVGIDIRYIGDKDVLKHFLGLRCGLIQSGHVFGDPHYHRRYIDVYGNEIITKAYLTTATITD